MLMWQFWLIIAGLFLIAEIFTTGFLVFWVGIGALLAMIVSFFTDNIIIQTSICVISSSLFILFTRPFIEKYIDKDKKFIVTNAKSIVGKKAIVTQDINAQSSKIGLVKVGEELWSAVSETDELIPANTTVEILDINGVKAIVRPIKETDIVK